MGFGQRDSVPSQLTGEAVVNQFRQLLENDRKRTEGYERYLYFRSFSVVFAQLTELIHLCFNSAKELRLFIQIPFRVFRDFPYVPLFLFWIYSVNFRYRTLASRNQITERTEHSEVTEQK